MEPTKKEYPVFEANQVLTNEHLNQGFDYLDEQERLTRANLTGIGIVCGLEISFNNDKSVINITKGCGITSEGYLVVLPDDQTLGYYKNYILPTDLKYEKFLKSVATGAQFDLWEITTDSENDTSLPPLTDTSFWQGGTKEKVVLLFVELKKEDLKDCTPNNCNDKGAKVTATIRPLLIETENISIYSPGLDVTPGELPDLVRLPRPKNFTDGIFNTYKAKLGEIWQNDELLNIDFNAVLTQYNAKYKVYDSNSFIDFNELLSAPKDAFIQYYYDFLLDVIQAYNELICFTASNPVCECVPNENTFSRHLTLGSINGEAPDEYRHVFTPAKALVDQQDETRSEELHLYMRLVEITRQFQPAELINQPIKITPTQYGDFPLAQKAIPYYYKPSEPAIKPTFAELWSTGKRCSGLAVATNSYHSDDEPLNYHLEAYNFFRIEGHIGKSSQDIKTMISTENLPFSALSLSSSDFNTFAANHPGLTHGAGVPTGGTFIMVNDDSVSNTVIADFFLPYQVYEVPEVPDQQERSNIRIIVISILIIIFICFMVRNCTPNEKYLATVPLNQQSKELDNRQSGQIKGANDVQHWRENR